MNYTDLLAHIRKIMRFIHLESKLLEKNTGISIPQLLALNFLNRQEGYTSTHGKIGQFLALNPSTVSGIITRLEKKGVVARIPGERDKRTSNVILTKNGKNVLDESLAVMEEKFKKKVKDYPDYDQESIDQSFQQIIDFLSVKDEEVKRVIRDLEE